MSDSSQRAENEGGPISPTPSEPIAVEFEFAEHDYPPIRASAEVGCRFELRRMLPRGEGRYAELFSVVGADPDRVLGLAEASDGVEPRLLAGHDAGGLFEFVVRERCPLCALAQRGGTPVRVTGADGSGRIVCHVPPEREAADLVAGFLEEHPTAELVAKRDPDRLLAPLTEGELRRLLDERLTDRQYEVLEAAYEAGYFRRPREVTGEELADELCIRPATLSQHVRAAQENLLSILYDNGGQNG